MDFAQGCLYVLPKVILMWVLIIGLIFLTLKLAGVV